MNRIADCGFRIADFSNHQTTKPMTKNELNPQSPPPLRGSAARYRARSAPNPQSEIRNPQS